MCLISVVIPIYNVEQYLPMCLDSVINQSYKNLEIICVNDCSPDNSYKIIEEYAGNDNRIKIINCGQNCGLSAARNYGIDASSGEYVYFLDSDDYIDEDYIETMFKAAKSSGLDIVVNTNVLMEFENGTKRILHFGNLNIEKSQCIRSVRAINNIMWSAWSHLYKLDFLKRNNLKFPVGFINEDMYFQPIAYTFVNEIFAINGSCYHYRIRQNSICSSQDNETNKIKNYVKIFNLVFEYLKNHNYIQNNKVLLYPTEFLYPKEKLEDIGLYDLIFQYFKKIETFVTRDAELYNTTELEFFMDILSDQKKAMHTNYYQKNFLNKLRMNLKNLSKKHKNTTNSELLYATNRRITQ